MESSGTGVPRFVVLLALALVFTLGLGLVSYLTHSHTIPNAGLPASNSKAIPNLGQYDPQVGLTTAYLDDLARLDYASAYQLLAPSVRVGLSAAQFESGQKAQGQLGRATVWIDDATSTRAEFLLAKPNGGGTTARHRFLLKWEEGRWWMDREVPIRSLPPASNLAQAVHDYINQQAGSVWAASVEILRQEPFEGGQLLLFSYIEPHPRGSLIPERLALLSYYVNGSGGWHFSGGGLSGLPAGMSVADIALGFTTFGSGERYVAYYGVVENADASKLTFQEPSGARHTLDLRNQKTILLLNERNPFEPVPVDHPFTSIQATDIFGNSLRTNPPDGG